MSSAEHLVQLLVLFALACPAALLVLLGLASASPRKPPEETVARLTSLTMASCIASLGAASALYALGGLHPSLWTAATWLSASTVALSLDLLVDGWSLTFALVAAIICGTVGAFSYRYLHREAGFHRYFTLFAGFVVGILAVALAGSVEVLFAGWELLGLTSALLVAFFHERRAPVENAMRVFATYRVSDAAMLAMAVLMHHTMGTGSLAAVFLSRSGDVGVPVSGGALGAISVLLVVAVAGKSALVPFSGWLPRAMEGPTPSSAVYYGALSVHAGCYLLWRAGPLLERSIVAQTLAGAAGLVTAVYATLLARVQTDVKSALSYATLTQVGLIVLEISLGLRTLAFAHILGNACLRLVQFLSAPNALDDLTGLEPPARRSRPRLLGLHTRALEGFSLDALIEGVVLGALRALVRAGERLDRALAGEDRR